MNKDLDYYLCLQGMKKVTRFLPFAPLQEKVAGHCYCAVMLAYDLMKKYDLGVDKERVIELLMFHDLVEIGMKFDYPADVVARNPELKKEKHRKEHENVASLSKTYDRSFVAENFAEFDKCETREARLANLCDKLEAAIHVLDCECHGFACREDFEFILKYCDRYLADFPELCDLIQSVKEGLQKYYDKFLESEE